MFADALVLIYGTWYSTVIIQELEGFFMVYVCNICGYRYDEAAGDPANGVEPGTTWGNVPDDYTCPLCGAAKAAFSPE